MKKHKYANELIKKFEGSEANISKITNPIEELQNNNRNGVVENQSLKQNFAKMEALRKQIADL